MQQTTQINTLLDPKGAKELWKPATHEVILISQLSCLF